jgi:chemotaxis protein CheD
MAEVVVTREAVDLSALGLGSCIGLAAYCRRSGVSGMVHIMLPEAFAGKPVDKPGKFADTGIPELFKQMKAAGAGEPHQLVFAYAGGAQVFQFGSSSTLEIGARNAHAVASHLSCLLSRIVAKEVGGNLGRTLTLKTDTGEVTVKCPQEGVRALCNLKSPADNSLRRLA